MTIIMYKQFKKYIYISYTSTLSQIYNLYNLYNFFPQIYKQVTGPYHFLVKKNWAAYIFLPGVGDMGVIEQLDCNQ